VGVNQVGLKLLKDLPTPREQLERLSQAERRRVGVQRNPMHAHPIDPLDPGFERRFLRTSGKAIAGDENGCLPVDFQGKPTDDRPDQGLDSTLAGEIGRNSVKDAQEAEPKQGFLREGRSSAPQLKEGCQQGSMTC
jgi:hypothetical protein